MGRSSVRLGAVFVAALVLCAVVGCSSSDTATPPSPSSTRDAGPAVPAAVTAADREAILEALRPAVESEIGQPVSFASSDIEVGGSYALVHVIVKDADGGDIDWASIAKFATAYEAGALDPASEALLHKGVDAWKVVEVRIGPTDTKRDAWTREYDIPPWSVPEE